MKPNLVMGLLVLALVGCGGGPQWRAVMQSNPNQLAGQKQFTVAPLDFAGLTVGQKSEADYLSAKEDEAKKGWVESKAGLEDEFIKSLRAGAVTSGVQMSVGAAGAPFILKPKVDFIEPGFYAFVASKPSQVKMTVKIVSADGKDVEEFVIEHAAGGASNSSRLRADGAALGEYAANYVASRVSPK